MSNTTITFPKLTERSKELSHQVDSLIVTAKLLNHTVMTAKTEISDIILIHMTYGGYVHLSFEFGAKDEIKMTMRMSGDEIFKRMDELFAHYTRGNTTTTLEVVELYIPNMITITQTLKQSM